MLYTKIHDAIKCIYNISPDNKKWQNFRNSPPVWVLNFSLYRKSTKISSMQMPFFSSTTERGGSCPGGVLSIRHAKGRAGRVP